MHKTQALICLKAALNRKYALKRSRYKKEKKLQPVSELNDSLRLSILEFIITTLTDEVNQTFRDLLNDSMFFIIKNPNHKFTELFTQMGNFYFEQSEQAILIFRNALVNKERVYHSFTK